MKKDLGLILGMALLMNSCNNKLEASPKEPCREPYPKPENKNTYTEFIPNPENNEYRRKFLGVKKSKFKKR